MASLFENFTRRNEYEKYQDKVNKMGDKLSDLSPDSPEFAQLNTEIKDMKEHSLIAKARSEYVRKQSGLFKGLIVEPVMDTLIDSYDPTDLGDAVSMGRVGSMALNIATSGAATLPTMAATEGGIASFDTYLDMKRMESEGHTPDNMDIATGFLWNTVPSAAVIGGGKLAKRAFNTELGKSIKGGMSERLKAMSEPLKKKAESVIERVERKRDIADQEILAKLDSASEEANGEAKAVSMANQVDTGEFLDETLDNFNADAGGELNKLPSKPSSPVVKNPKRTRTSLYSWYKQRKINRYADVMNISKKQALSQLNEETKLNTLKNRVMQSRRIAVQAAAAGVDKKDIGVDDVNIQNMAYNILKPVDKERQKDLRELSEVISQVSEGKYSNPMDILGDLKKSDINITHALMSPDIVQDPYLKNAVKHVASYIHSSNDFAEAIASNIHDPHLEDALQDIGFLEKYMVHVDDAEDGSPIYRLDTDRLNFNNLDKEVDDLIGNYNINNKGQEIHNRVKPPKKKMATVEKEVEEITKGIQKYDNYEDWYDAHGKASGAEYRGTREIIDPERIAAMAEVRPWSDVAHAVPWTDQNEKNFIKAFYESRGLNPDLMGYNLKDRNRYKGMYRTSETNLPGEGTPIPGYINNYAYTKPYGMSDLRDTPPSIELGQLKMELGVDSPEEYKEFALAMREADMEANPHIIDQVTKKIEQSEEWTGEWIPQGRDISATTIKRSIKKMLSDSINFDAQGIEYMQNLWNKENLLKKLAAWRIDTTGDMSERIFDASKEVPEHVKEELRTLFKKHTRSVDPRTIGKAKTLETTLDINGRKATIDLEDMTMGELHEMMQGLAGEGQEIQVIDLMRLTQNAIRNSIGKDIMSEAGKSDFDNVMHYYINKFGLPEDIKLDLVPTIPTKSGKGAYGRYIPEEKRLQLATDVGQSKEAMLSTLRHELEHANDIHNRGMMERNSMLDNDEYVKLDPIFMFNPSPKMQKATIDDVKDMSIRDFWGESYGNHMLRHEDDMWEIAYREERNIAAGYVEEMGAPIEETGKGQVRYLDPDKDEELSELVDLYFQSFNMSTATQGKRTNQKMIARDLFKSLEDYKAFVNALGGGEEIFGNKLLSTARKNATYRATGMSKNQLLNLFSSNNIEKNYSKLGFGMNEEAYKGGDSYTGHVLGTLKKSLTHKMNSMDSAAELAVSGKAANGLYTSFKTLIASHVSGIIGAGGMKEGFTAPALIYQNALMSKGFNFDDFGQALHSVLIKGTGDYMKIQGRGISHHILAITDGMFGQNLEEAALFQAIRKATSVTGEDYDHYAYKKLIGDLSDLGEPVSKWQKKLNTFSRLSLNSLESGDLVGAAAARNEVAKELKDLINSGKTYENMTEAQHAMMFQAGVMNDEGLHDMKNLLKSRMDEAGGLNIFEIPEGALSNADSMKLQNMINGGEGYYDTVSRGRFSAGNDPVSKGFMFMAKTNLAILTETQQKILGSYSSGYYKRELSSESFRRAGYILGAASFAATGIAVAHAVEDSIKERRNTLDILKDSMSTVGVLNTVLAATPLAPLYSKEGVGGSALGSTMKSIKHPGVFAARAIAGATLYKRYVDIAGKHKTEKSRNNALHKYLGSKRMESDLKRNYSNHLVPMLNTHIANEEEVLKFM